MLRAEVYARALVCRGEEVWTPPSLSLSKVETVHEKNLGPALSPFCVEEGAPLRGAWFFGGVEAQCVLKSTSTQAHKSTFDKPLL